LTAVPPRQEVSASSPAAPRISEAGANLRIEATGGCRIQGKFVEFEALSRRLIVRSAAGMLVPARAPVNRRSAHSTRPSAASHCRMSVIAPLLDHLVGAGGHGVRYCKAERLVGACTGRSAGSETRTHEMAPSRLLKFALFGTVSGFEGRLDGVCRISSMAFRGAWSSVGQSCCGLDKLGQADEIVSRHC
jgi:hypothetical protein